jgi:hypothetical protein
MVVKKILPKKALKKAPKKAPAKKSVKKKIELDYSLPFTFNTVFPSKPWSIAGEIENCSYNLIGIRSVINLVAEADDLSPHNDSLYLVARELDRMEKELTRLSDELYVFSREEKSKK